MTLWSLVYNGRCRHFQFYTCLISAGRLLVGGLQTPDNRQGLSLGVMVLVVQLESPERRHEKSANLAAAPEVSTVVELYRNHLIS